MIFHIKQKYQLHTGLFNKQPFVFELKGTPYIFTEM